MSSENLSWIPLKRSDLNLDLSQIVKIHLYSSLFARKSSLTVEKQEGH